MRLSEQVLEDIGNEKFEDGRQLYEGYISNVYHFYRNSRKRGIYDTETEWVRGNVWTIYRHNPFLFWKGPQYILYAGEDRVPTNKFDQAILHQAWCLAGEVEHAKRERMAGNAKGCPDG